VLLVKTAETAKLLQQLAVEQAEVVRVRSRVEVEESTVKRQAEAVAELQADAQSEVEAAMPVMENAIRALDALNKNVCGACVLHDVCELCACFTPVPSLIRACYLLPACVILGVFPDSS
jgi:hypothetical protein